MSNPAVDLADALQASLGSQYRLGPELGRGGMGVVFQATDTTLDRRVAVKVIHPELAVHESLTRRFLAEARLIARLRHPGIVTVHAAGTADGMLWYVMDEVPGESLRHRLVRDGRLPPDEVARIVADLAGALDAAGRAGVVHRDVKPENVLLDAGTGRALLADFGIARAMLGDGTGGPTTGRGVAIGTPAYMSPEQAAGEEVDGRSDIYALGIVAYEMLTGHPPFEGPGRVVVSKHISERPAAVGRVRPDCPPALAAAVMRALEKTPAERWQTGEELRAAVAGERTTPAPAAVTRAARRRRWAAGAGLVGLLVLGGVALERREELSPPAGVNARLSMLILPFRNVRGAQDAEWLRDASVSMLGLNLSQWNDLTVIQHEQLHDLLAKHDVEDADQVGLAMARRLAREAGVWTIVMGDYTQVGDSLHIVARLYDVASGRQLETAQIGGTPGEDVRPLFDGLAARLLDLSGAPEGTATGLARATTGSLAAFRSYLDGLEHLNHWDLAAAERDFRAAVEVDSTFSLAYYKLALTRGWLVGAQDSVADRAMTRASAYAERLPAHDRALVGAYRAFLQQDYGAARDLYRQLLVRDSTDADAWYGLGEAWYHDGKSAPPARQTASLRAFRRTLALDGDYALAYDHVNERLTSAARRGAPLALLAADSFVVARRDDGRPALDSAVTAAARRRAAREAVTVARGWTASQPTTTRAHVALVDAHFAAGDPAGAFREIARYAEVVPNHAERPFLEARVRFASGEVEAAAALLRGVLDTAAPRDFRAYEDTPTVLDDIASAANVFAYQGDLLNATRALTLLDGVRREVFPALEGDAPAGTAGAAAPAGGTHAEHWHRRALGELYSGVGAPAASLRRVWSGAAEASRVTPPAERRMVAYSGASAAVGLLASPEPDASAVEELQAITGDTMPREVRALMALRRGDSAAARRTMAEPESLMTKGSTYIAWRRPLAALVYNSLGEPRQALAQLEDFEPELLSHHGFDARWGILGRVRLMRAWAHEALGHREEARAEYQRALAQWKHADPALNDYLRQAQLGLARLAGTG